MPFEQTEVALHYTAGFPYAVRTTSQTIRYSTRSKCGAGKRSGRLGDDVADPLLRNAGLLWFCGLVSGVSGRVQRVSYPWQ